MELNGIHHVTAISAKIRDNHRFYTKIMGLRLVKKTVNQDDVSAWHLFYADANGTPGTDFTFFDWPTLPPERRGTNSIYETQLRVAGRDAVEWWANHLKTHGVKIKEPLRLAGRLTLRFEDPEGQRLAIVDDEGTGLAHPWDKSPVPRAFQIRGLGPLMLSVKNYEPLNELLTRTMKLKPVRDYLHPDNARHVVYVYNVGTGGAAAEVHVAVQPELPPARQGAGAVHHVAFRVHTFEQHTAWIERLTSLGIPNTGLVDRFYFRSCYFREPNGILFEIATDEPGFTADEPEEKLGQHVALPPFLEPRRAEIVAGLKPID